MTVLPDHGTVVIVDRVFDGHRIQQPEQPIGVFVRNGVIVSVAEASQLVTSHPLAEHDYFADATLSPGFIDSHVHLTMPGDGTSHEPAVLRAPESRFRTAGINLSAHLAAGVTTVRDLGSRADFLGWSPEDAALAPRLIRFGPPMTAPGGHMRHFGGVVSTAEEARRFVYQNASDGANGIKIAASGGGSRGTRPHEVTLGPDVVSAAVTAAHELGLRTTVHAMAADSVDIALRAGSDGIEHVAFLAEDGDSHFAEELTRRAADAGVAFGSTLGVNFQFLEFPNARTADAPEFAEQTERTRYYIENARRLREMGTPLALGSDAGWKYTPFGQVFTEMRMFNHAGYSPLDILRTITAENARHVGLDHLIGNLDPGACADLVVLRGDPTQDLEVLRNVQAVYRDGRRVVGVPSLARPRMTERDAASLM